MVNDEYFKPKDLSNDILFLDPMTGGCCALGRLVHPPRLAWAFGNAYHCGVCGRYWVLVDGRMVTNSAWGIHPLVFKRKSDPFATEV